MIWGGSWVPGKQRHIKEQRCIKVNNVKWLIHSEINYVSKKKISPKSHPFNVFVWHKHTSDKNSPHLAQREGEFWLSWLHVINRAAGRVGDKKIESFRIKDTGEISHGGSVKLETDTDWFRNTGWQRRKLCMLNLSIEHGILSGFVFPLYIVHLIH